MKTNTIYQIVGIVALSAGAAAVGMSAWARIKKRKDQKEIQDATQEAAALNESFSDASGIFARKNLKRNYAVTFNERGVPVLVNRPETPTSSQKASGGCPNGQVLGEIIKNGERTGDFRCVTPKASASVRSTIFN